MKQLISDQVNLSDELVFKRWVKSLQDALTIEDSKQPVLLNGWANNAGRITKYYKLFDRVYIEGYLISGAGLAFILPEGYRPDESLSFQNIAIDTNGNVTPSANTSLDGISFRA